MGADGPLELERRGWQALATGPEAATAFYEQVLDAEVLMLFPGGTVIDDRAAVIASMGGPPWSSYRLDDVREMRLTADTAVVAYAAVAEREGSPYSALVSSLYVRRSEGWRLAVHQQTPR
ncbi:DUF4440 domain-containing protein [Geodermatophilus sp. YIM 151500]|uniref:nuclear transport factor 2 family protein n=1 Tax=Geodermatophilus sp. YIM 151500 TaxID=2984531 RepID=UPI0021E5134A|nr:nuclear transport factor 2 family protein [Geodermatophilus sp. YIM 151500]MCV2488819.1 DUF4440 domain-containing protein [Geodermatophilus sp. YIM 151500]